MRRENFLEGVSCLVGRGRGKMRVFSPQVHQKVFSLKWRENLVAEWQQCPCRLLHCFLFLFFFIFFFSILIITSENFLFSFFFFCFPLDDAGCLFFLFFLFLGGLEVIFFFLDMIFFLINLCDCVFLGCLSFLFCFNWASFLIRLYE